MKIDVDISRIGFIVFMRLFPHVFICKKYRLLLKSKSHVKPIYPVSLYAFSGSLWLRSFHFGITWSISVLILSNSQTICLSLPV